ncbi:MAG: hypothetical protein ACJ8J7_05565 [Sulfurifustaceae bacterium]
MRHRTNPTLSNFAARARRIAVVVRLSIVGAAAPTRAQATLT